ncbi:MAG: hypothetical protein GY862_22335 [Gammaproteobacteria bacterium]|nr:hypothetical protein [Gammaproteobacteria bacterium]
MERVDFYVKITFDGLHLFIAQQDVRSIEIIADVETRVKEDEKMAGIAGWLVHGEEQFPVFCFSRELALLPTLPKESAFCVMVQSEATVFGIPCAKVESLDSTLKLPLRQIPIPMQMPISPVSNLVIHENEIGCVTSSSALVSYLAAWAEAQMNLDEE